jgi:hypothetical protein
MPNRLLSVSPRPHLLLRRHVRQKQSILPSRRFGTIDTLAAKCSTLFSCTFVTNVCVLQLQIATFSSTFHRINSRRHTSQMKISGRFALSRVHVEVSLVSPWYPQQIQVSIIPDLPGRNTQFDSIPVRHRNSTGPTCGSVQCC